ncbi:MAG: histidinol dehydrogenase, partial [Candidatus Azotimanducaceae bacterium]
MISIIQQESAAFESEFAALLRIPDADQKQVRDVVQNILADVRERGDEAVVEYTNRFDGQTVSDVNALRIQSD